jgi:indole-3-glycerol phosphate synthase
MEALAIGSAPPRPGLPAPTRYSHLGRPRTLAAARRPLAAAHMDDAAAGGGRPSPAPPRCTRAETVSYPVPAAISSSVKLRES